MTDFYSQNRCVCSTRSHGPLLCAFCLSFHFNVFQIRFRSRSMVRTEDLCLGLYVVQLSVHYFLQHYFLSVPCKCTAIEPLGMV